MSAFPNDTLARQFQSLRDLAISPTAPQIQIDEMRMAFFAGATVVLAVTKVIAELPERDGVAMLKALHDECDAFVHPTA
ncbi:protein of unknown function [Pararobbsia alpina]|uniref:hypothetical protein n=1 Tax=Pararobbsia alpina TaxID=621374 RepID=UPI0039A58569